VRAAEWLVFGNGGLASGGASARRTLSVEVVGGDLHKGTHLPGIAGVGAGGFDRGL
jgi:hypothetical protein